MDEQRTYYWLKFKRDFFKRHDIRIIEAMPNGKEIVLFYLKLLCESVDHEGRLRFSDSIPYTEEMLAGITNTTKDIVAEAMKILKQLELLEVLGDGTLYMTKVSKMIGSETDWARKKRNFRQKKQDEEDDERTTEGQDEDKTRTSGGQSEDKTRTSGGQSEDKTRTSGGQKRTMSDKSKSKSKSIELELELELEKEIDIEHPNGCNESIGADAPTPTRSKDTRHTFGEYKHVRLTDEEHAKLIDQYGEADTEAAIRILDEYIEEKGNKSKNHYLTMRKWVFNAVNEQRQRNTSGSGFGMTKEAQAMQASYDMMNAWAEGGTT